MNVKHLILIIRNFNLTKSLYYSLKSFSFKEAIKLPIIIGRNTRILKWGKIVIDCKPCPGMISIGARMLVDYENQVEPLMLSNNGVITFHGPIKIHPGAKICVKENAELEFGGKNTIGGKTKVICYKSIKIGENTGCSWDCQILDTDFHFLVDLTNGMPYKRTVPILIGDNVFIGNHCNIGKGTKITNGSVISSWSKVSGSFKRKGENLLISGNPAQVVDTDVTMTHAWDIIKEAEYSKLLNEK